MTLLIRRLMSLPLFVVGAAILPFELLVRWGRATIAARILIVGALLWMEWG